MADGYAELDAYIARLRALPELARRAAPDVADAVRDELRRQITAGTDPTGRPWQRTEDGRQALATAADALTVGAHGTRVIMRLRGHIARHHLGRAKGGTVRRILPTAGIPAPMARAITRVLVDHFRGAMRG